MKNRLTEEFRLIQLAKLGEQPVIYNEPNKRDVADLSHNNEIIDSLYVYFAVLSAFFFSYIPLIYVLDFIDIKKESAYIIFMLITFSILLFYIYTNRLHIYRRSTILFLLSLFFAAYAAISYGLTINYFNDHQTLIVLSVLNPLYILLASLLADKKAQILSFIYLLVSVYFLFVIAQWIAGKLESGPDTIFIQIFAVTDAEYYQNINNYLGLMAILTLGLFTNRGWLINTIKLATITLCFFFMLKVGDRSSIIALAMVLVFWFLLLHINLQSGYFLLTIMITIVVSYALLIGLDKLVIIMRESDLTALNRFASLFTGSDNSHREFLFTKAIDQLTNSPENLFFGGGMNVFSVFTKEYNINLYPHNIFLELLAEYGIIGFILFMLPVFYLFRLRRIELGSYVGNDRINRLFFMLFLYFLIIQMFTGSLRNIWFFVFITFLLLPKPNKNYLLIKL